MPRTVLNALSALYQLSKIKVGPIALNLLLREQAQGSKETCPTSQCVMTSEW